MAEKKFSKGYRNEDDLRKEKHYKDLQRKYEEDIEIDEDSELFEKFDLRRLIH